MQFIAYIGMGQTRFEAETGLSRGYLNKLRNEPSPTKIRSILSRFPELNQQWLLTGEGEMLNTTVVPVEAAQATEVDENTHGVKFMESEAGMLINVPLVPYAALGSPADEFAQLIRENGCERVSFPVDGKHRGSYYAFRVEGDSMDDGTRHGFQPGDIVLVRELQRDDWAPRLHYGKWPYWVIVWGNCVRLKQIVAQDDAGTTITCHSLNPSPEYTDFTLRLTDVNRLFNVIRVQPKDRVFG